MKFLSCRFFAANQFARYRRNLLAPSWMLKSVAAIEIQGQWAVITSWSLLNSPRTQFVLILLSRIFEFGQKYVPPKTWQAPNSARVKTLKADPPVCMAKMVWRGCTYIAMFLYPLPCCWGNNFREDKRDRDVLQQPQSRVYLIGGDMKVNVEGPIIPN
jgi:hypothetical protein